MNREIKFRGLRKDGKGWLYGSIVYPDKLIRGVWMLPEVNMCDFYPDIEDGEKIESHEHQGIIIGRFIEVVPETVGQFTGFTADKRKKNFEKEVYEGDVFRETEENELGDRINYYVVMWVWQRGAFCMINNNHYLVMLNNDLSEDSDYNYIFDDPQLYDFAIDIGALAKVGNIHEGGFLHE